MKIRIALLALIFSLKSFADETTISTQTFNNTILPSIKKLVDDYYVLLVQLDPFNKDVIQLKENISNLKKKWQGLSETCVKNKEKCNEIFLTLKEDFIKENQQILKIESNFKLSSNTRKNLTDSRIILSKTLSSISDDSHKILISLNLFKFERKEFYKITDYLKDMKLNLNILTTGFLDDEYQDNFYFIYSNFFKMLENDILEKSNLELFKRELENLNISWNSFNMKVPKWKASLSADSLHLLESMHKRWNSVLRLVWGN